jgi:murein L,D-transpeptidase YafK
MLTMTRRFAVLSSLALGLTGCASKFRTYNGPEVTRLQLYKGDRKLFLFNKSQVLKVYRIDLGFSPVGPKRFEGDGKTPEGSYTIDKRNPESSFHLSVGISYPNATDRDYAAERGRKPGGDIYIHGAQRPGIDQFKPDWTAGCIAVSDREIEDIYAMVRDGTTIDIFP